MRGCTACVGVSSPSQKGASRARAAPRPPQELSPDTTASGLLTQAVGPGTCSSPDPGEKRSSNVWLLLKV